jgi:hypothetical protein
MFLMHTSVHPQSQSGLTAFIRVWWHGSQQYVLSKLLMLGGASVLGILLHRGKHDVAWGKLTFN